VKPIVDMASPADLDDVLALLRANHLPVDGLANHFDAALVIREERRIVGSAALEIHGDSALLRSVAPRVRSLRMALDRHHLARRGRRLEYLTIAWNSLEGLAAIAAGALAGSVSLVGFGVDSAIEVTSGAALLWRLSADHDPARRERRERLALRIVAVAFLALATYIAVEAAADLWNGAAPAPSPVGIGLAVASLVIMPLLARAKRRVAGALGSRALHADATQTDLCAYLSAILLGGLVLNATFGLWWADPVAALLMTPIIVTEGVKGLRGDACPCH
jgi:divalent metal cation (Fe/Co/Zn/Cd) transporter